MTDPSRQIALEQFEPGLWAFVAINGDVQIGWCRKADNGWYIEDMDSERLAGPFDSLKLAEQAGAKALAHLSDASNPGW